MALSFHTTTAPLFGRLPVPGAADMSFLQDVHPEVTDALLGFVFDPLDPANVALGDLLDLPPDDDDAAAFLEAGQQHCAKKQRACADDAPSYGLLGLDDGHQQRNGGGNHPQQSNGGGNHHLLALGGVLDEFVRPLTLPLPLPLPPPPPQPQQLPEGLVFVRGADTKKPGSGAPQSVQSAAARQRRKRISEKMAELSRLIPGGNKLNTAEMLEEAARHVKLLQAQVGVLALMNAVGSDNEKDKVPSMAQEQMHALLVRGSVQERLAAAGRCLVPRTLVDAVAMDSAVKSNAVVSRDLGRFVASLGQ